MNLGNEKNKGIIYIEDNNNFDKDYVNIYKGIYDDIINNFNKKYFSTLEKIQNNKKNIIGLESLKKNLQNSIEEIINKKLIKETKQLNKLLVSLEQSKKYFIQQNFLKKTKIDMLESEIGVYMDMEEEFEEMKIKLKYDEGEFLKNEKKENEILILRAENSNLKIIIEKNEKLIKKYEEKIIELQNKLKKIESIKHLSLENKYNNIVKSKEHLTGRPSNCSQFLNEMNSKENKSCNKNYNLNNYSNSNSASITINSNNNNNVVRNKQKNKSKKNKKNYNIVLNMKQMRKKSHSNIINSPNNNSHNKLFKSSSSSSLSKNSINSNNIINVNINYIDNISNYISKSNKKTNLTKQNNNCKFKVPMNKEDLIVMKYKNNMIKSPSSKSHNNSNILYNIFNNFPMTSRTKNIIKKNNK